MSSDLRPRHLLAVLIVIVEEDAVLLVQSRFARAPWGLPGGLLEVGESVEQAAAREMLEEAGLLIQVTRTIGFYSVPSEQALALTFEAKVIGGELLQITTETQAAAYFPLDQLPELMRPYHRERVSDFTSHLPTPIFRTQ